MNTTPLSKYFLLMSLLCGIDLMHGPHHVAQKSSTTILPFKSEICTGLPLTQLDNSSAGAGFPCIASSSARTLLASGSGASAAVTVQAKRRATQKAAEGIFIGPIYASRIHRQAQLCASKTSFLRVRSSIVKPKRSDLGGLFRKNRSRGAVLSFTFARACFTMRPAYDPSKRSCFITGDHCRANCIRFEPAKARRHGPRDRASHRKQAYARRRPVGRTFRRCLSQSVRQTRPRSLRRKDDRGHDFRRRVPHQSRRHHACCHASRRARKSSPRRSGESIRDESAPRRCGNYRAPFAYSHFRSAPWHSRL